jgi:hypothetical protein
MKKVIILLCGLASFSYANTIKADVTAVNVNGNEGAYTFAVTLESDETGCDQYADWWEVLSEKGELLYRRILVHSHPNTQPFTRSGGQVAVKADDVIYVRAHMNKLGYSGVVMKGSVAKGFKVVTDSPTFSKKIETQKPLPQGCLF